MNPAVEPATNPKEELCKNVNYFRFLFNFSYIVNCIAENGMSLSMKEENPI